METSLSIANYFIKKARESGAEMTPMKLIKLVYISYGWYLAFANKPLINEKVQAWKYGPVVPSVYQEFKKFYKGQIDLMYVDPLSGETPLPTDPEIIKFLDRIWDVYGKYNGLQLSALTHQKDTPWDIAWNEEGGKRFNSVTISDETIRSHYAKKMSPTQNVANG